MWERENVEEEDENVEEGDENVGEGSENVGEGKWDFIFTSVNCISLSMMRVKPSNKKC